jgi:hypothetical protein
VGNWVIILGQYWDKFCANFGARSRSILGPISVPILVLILGPILGLILRPELGWFMGRFRGWFCLGASFAGSHGELGQQKVEKVTELPHLFEVGRKQWVPLNIRHYPDDVQRPYVIRRPLMLFVFFFSKIFNLSFVLFTIIFCFVSVLSLFFRDRWRKNLVNVQIFWS